MGECGKTIIKCRGKEIELPKGIEWVIEDNCVRIYSYPKQNQETYIPLYRVKEIIDDIDEDDS